MKTSKLFPLDHEDLARALFEARQSFLALRLRLAAAYPDRQLPTVLAEQVQTSVDLLRIEMEKVFYAENDYAVGSPYYNRANASLATEDTESTERKIE